jgi:serine/threonine protein kinase
MANNVVLFKGDSEIDQLFQIFRILGTPNERIWPGVSQLPDYKTTFPQWAPQNLAQFNPQLDREGLDLLQKLLAYKPDERLTAKTALMHPFFRNVEIVKPPYI